MKDAPFRHRCEYAAYLAFKGMVRLLPHRAARPLGSAVGDLAWVVDRRHRRVALRNLALALPELSLPARRRLVRSSFRHLGATLCDVVSATRFDAVDFCERLTLEGWEHLESADAAGRGVLVMSAHLGSWEVAAQPVGLYKGNFHVVGRPADNPWLDAEVERLRSRFGNHRIDRRGAARQMLRLLADGGRVGVLLDQRVIARREGIEVPFFGRPAWTTPVVARLSLRTGAPVVPLFGHLAAGARWRVVLRPPIFPSGEGEEAVRALTRRYLEVVEEEIRAAPQLWLWMHDRWGEPRH